MRRNRFGSGFEFLESRDVPSIDGLTIPTGHPRLLFTPDTLTEARAWYASHSFIPSASDPFANAFAYQMTGNTAYAQLAITSLMNFTISSTELAGVASDNYRWADWVPVVYDWCYDQLTPDQRSTFTDRYNNYTTIEMGKSWGGPSMPSSNYYWGIWRNELNWGIATYGENPSASSYIDDALVTRWQNSFIPWANGPGSGGVAQEGTQYGRYMLQYATIPLVTAINDGRNLLNETNFYTEAAYNLIYSTSPGPLAAPGNKSYYQLFPFNDDEFSMGHAPSNDVLYAGLMSIIAENGAGTALSSYINQWMSQVGSIPPNYISAVSSSGPTETKDFSYLPTDYYAPGPGYLYAKSDWAPSAMALEFQLGGLKGAGHAQFDYGTFQISYNGEWLSEETTGYASSIVGFNGIGTTSVASTLSHNGVVVNGVGGVPARKGNPTITRLESQPDYTFASVDLTDAYESSDSRYNNPAVQSVVRDFVYVRDMNALIVLDRDSSASPLDQTSFLLHFPNNPTLSGNSVVGLNGGDELKLTTLTPAGQSQPTMQVVNESPSLPDNSTHYQYRLEETTTGQAQSYLLNVLQAKSVSGADLKISMSEDATEFVITLTDPTTGKTSIVKLAKGMTSTGGSIGVSPSGTPNSFIPFTSTVEGIRVSTSGVTWGTAGSASSLRVAAPATVVASLGTEVTVSAVDDSGNIDSGYQGSVHFSSSDVLAGLPADYTFTSADAGVHKFMVAMKTGGIESITVSDIGADSITGEAAVMVTSPAIAFQVTAPSLAIAGLTFATTVTALDAFGNRAAGYTGTVHFTSTDGHASLPANYTFTSGDGGSHVFTITLKTAGSKSITATDTTTGSVTGNASISVNAAAASVLQVSAPSTATAGSAFSTTVTAKDVFGNTAAGYTGTVHFTSTDGQAVLPANYTFTAADAGTHSFTITLKTEGSESITATDTVTGSITGSANVTVSAATGTLQISAPSTVTAGSSFSTTVTAKDAFGNTATGYTGTVHFTSTDGQAVLPANYTFTAADAGSHTFTITLKTAGPKSITVTDTTTGSVTGNASVSVNAAAASLFQVSAPSTATAGSAFSATVTAKDAFGNTATGYTGTVHFTSTDGQAVLPANYTFTAADAGSHSFTIALKTAGSKSITLTDTTTGSVTGNASVSVNATAASVLQVSAPSTATAGSAFSATVTAKDAFGNTAAGYTGTVHFTSTDGQAVLPANYIFTAADAGTHTFTIMLKTAGLDSITTTDTVTGSIAGSVNVTVSAATGTLQVSAPPTATAGSSFSTTVTAKDAFGNTAAGYTGTVHFTSTDGQAVLPANYTFTAADAGSHTFTIILKTAGSKSITATDTTTGSVNGNASVSVNATVASVFQVSAPSTATAGSAFSTTLTAKDAFGNTATGYTGTVHLTSTDAQAVLPANYTFTAADAGSRSFTIMLKTAGSKSITATDTTTGSVTGNASVTVNAAAASVLQVSAPSTATAGSAFSTTVTAKDAFGNTATGYTGTVHFTSTDAQAVLPANYTFTATDAGTYTFTIMLKTAGSESITATDTTTGSITGNKSVTVNASIGTLQLSAPLSATAGSPFSTMVTAKDAFGNTAAGYTGTVHFTSTDGQAVLPANYTFTAADAGSHSFTITLKSAGPKSITATDTTAGSITGNASVSVNAAAASVLQVSAPSTATAGSAFSTTVTAKDAFGNTATGYTSTVHFTSTDAQAVLPANYTFTAADAGSHSFTIALKTAGPKSITVTDTTTGSVTGNASVSVNAAAASVFQVSAPSTATAGSAFSTTVTAKDAFGNTATGYNGTVHFTSTDAQAVLPANYTFTAADAGVHTFSITLETAGLESLAITDTSAGSISGSANINVVADLQKAAGFAVGQDGGGTSAVDLYNSDGSVSSTLTPFPGTTGGVRTAMGDFNGDGTQDVAVGTGPGTVAEVKVLDGKTGAILFDVAPFDQFTGGVFVAAGDITGNGKADLVISPDLSGGPRIEVYEGGDFHEVANYFGIDDPDFRGGARVGVGDLSGDGHADLVVSAGFGGGPRISVYDGESLIQGQLVHLIPDFFAFEPSLRNGAYVAVGDVNGDGTNDLIFGAGPGGGPRVLIVSGQTLFSAGSTAAINTPVANLFAGDPNNRGGVRVAAKNLDGDRYADLLTAAGSGGSGITAHLGQKLILGDMSNDFAFDAFPGFNGGVFVG